ncbi:MAG: hypothetical protein MZV64_42490 [Ignavibacteriales bacterium]|nr:hypothetical protein [Ignavibacteriales bacterium]
MPDDSSLSCRIRHDAAALLQEADHGQLPGAEGAGLPEVPREAGADARRARPREVRGLRPVLGGVPGGRDLPRGGGERRLGRRPGPRYANDLPDPQDALHLLRLLRGGLPGGGHLHGQGLRAGGLQQAGLHLGQAGPARPRQGGGRCRPLTCQTPMKLGALGDVHGDFASVRAIMARHPDVEWWMTVGDLADERGAHEAPPALLHWIKGNNDNLEVIAELGDGRRRMPNLRYLPERRAAQARRRVAGRARRHVRADLV